MKSRLTLQMAEKKGFAAISEMLDAAPAHLLGTRYAFLIGSPMARRWGRERLEMARVIEPERPEVRYWTGLYKLVETRQGKDCLAEWEVARSRDPKAPLPLEFRDYYLQLGGSEDALSELFGG